MSRLTVAALAASMLPTVGVLAQPSQTGEKRAFTIAAIEPRGGANVNQEALPAEPLPAGGGYVLRPPDQTGRWEVSTYLWSTPQIVVHQGDAVSLDFVGINGAAHPTEIKSLGKAFTLKRGQVIKVEFTADKPGVYSVICSSHQPTMRSEIVVLPRSP